MVKYYIEYGGHCEIEAASQEEAEALVLSVINNLPKSSNEIIEVLEYD